MIESVKPLLEQVNKELGITTPIDLIRYNEDPEKFITPTIGTYIPDVLKLLTFGSVIYHFTGKRKRYTDLSWKLERDAERDQKITWSNPKHAVDPNYKYPAQKDYTYLNYHARRVEEDEVMGHIIEAFDDPKFVKEAEECYNLIGGHIEETWINGRLSYFKRLSFGKKRDLDIKPLTKKEKKKIKHAKLIQKFKGYLFAGCEWIHPDPQFAEKDDEKIMAFQEYKCRVLALMVARRMFNKEKTKRRRIHSEFGAYILKGITPSQAGKQKKRKIESETKKASYYSEEKGKEVETRVPLDENDKLIKRALDDLNPKQIIKRPIINILNHGTRNKIFTLLTEIGIDFSHLTNLSNSQLRKKAKKLCIKYDVPLNTIIRIEKTGSWEISDPGRERFEVREELRECRRQIVNGGELEYTEVEIPEHDEEEDQPFFVSNEDASEEGENVKDCTPNHRWFIPYLDSFINTLYFQIYNLKKYLREIKTYIWLKVEEVKIIITPDIIHSYSYADT